MKIILYLILISGFLYANIDYDSYFKNCSQIIYKTTYKICYNYSFNGPTAISYDLYGSLVNKENIKKRPRFYEEKSLPYFHRVSYYDYIRTGYDRGHINNDASNDYSKKALHEVYTMANIVPQAPMVNRKTWVKVEKFARKMAVKYKKVSVLNIILYKNKILQKKNKNSRYEKKLETKHIVIPSGFIKILKFDNKEICFYYKNDLNVDWRHDKLKSHIFDCDRLTSN